MVHRLTELRITLRQVVRRDEQVRWLVAVLLAIGLSLTAASFVSAQPPTNSAPPQEEMTRIDLPQGTITLDALFTFVSKNYQISYDYTSDIGKRTVNIRTPAAVPTRLLPLLVSSALKQNGLAVVDSDVPGWKRVIQGSELFTYAPFDSVDKVLPRDGPGGPATQVFLLKKYDPMRISPIIQNLLSTNGAKVESLPDVNALIVTDFAANVQRAAEMIDLVERAGTMVFEFYTVKNSKSTDLLEQVSKVFSEKKEDSTATSASPIRMFDAPNANRILVAGRKDLVEEALALLTRFDAELDITTRIYKPRNLTAERLQAILEGYLPAQDVSRIYEGTVDEDGNLLVVRATPDIHRQIEQLLDAIDQTPAATDSPIRIHELKNAKAEDVLVTLLALQDAYGTGFGFGGGFGGGFPFGGFNPYMMGGMGSPFGTGGFGNGFGGGFNQPVQTLPLPLQPGQPTTPGANQGTMGGGGMGTGMGTGMGAGGFGGTGGFGGGQTGGAGQTGGNQNQRGQGGNALGGGFGGGSALLPGGARISADIGTNSLIISAPANVHPMYQRLIEQLDQRRPQVVIEAKIIAVNETDGFNFGIEVSGGDRNGAKRAFLFSSFGLSEVDPITGALEIIPGRGGNATVVNPDVADVVLRALVTHLRSRVLSTPKILVNDNQTGTLESLVSIPFASVNASNTVSTTSVGGNQDAGTRILVTPHINEANHLQLEFEIEFSSFTGTGTATLPPARQIEKVSSVVTVPNGQTVIVGGLKRTGERKEYSGIPWIEKVPLVRDLFGRTDESGETTSFFVFIRPVILRDSRFGDLQFLSDRQAGMMGIPSEYPTSLPVMIHPISMNVCPPSSE